MRGRARRLEVGKSLRHAGWHQAHEGQQPGSRQRESCSCRLQELECTTMPNRPCPPADHLTPASFFSTPHPDDCQAQPVCMGHHCRVTGPVEQARQHGSGNGAKSDDRGYEQARADRQPLQAGACATILPPALAPRGVGGKLWRASLSVPSSLNSRLCFEF